MSAHTVNVADRHVDRHPVDPIVDILATGPWVPERVAPKVIQYAQTTLNRIAVSNALSASDGNRPS